MSRKNLRDLPLARAGALLFHGLSPNKINFRPVAGRQRFGTTGGHNALRTGPKPARSKKTEFPAPPEKEPQREGGGLATAEHRARRAPFLQKRQRKVITKTPPRDSPAQKFRWICTHSRPTNRAHRIFPNVFPLLPSRFLTAQHVVEKSFLPMWRGDAAFA